MCSRSPAAEKGVNMDTLQAVTTLLGNGFFPILICGVLLWYIYRKDGQTRETLKEMGANHKEEIAELRKSIDNNTAVVQKLLDKMGSD